MNDYKLDYWTEAVEVALEDIENNLSAVDIKSIAESMMISADQQSMAFGSDVADNPLKVEVNNLKTQLKHDQDINDTQEQIYRQHIADAHHVDILDVHIEYDRVWIR